MTWIVFFRYTMWIKEAWFKVQMPFTLDWVFVTVIYRGYHNGLTVYHNAQNPSTDPSAQSGKLYILPTTTHRTQALILVPSQVGF